MQKKWKPIEAEQKKVNALQSELGISSLFCQLLVQRGVFTYDDAKQFFRPQLEDLHDPFKMKDMDKAVERLSMAIKGNEKILLYGDYDVDGTCSVAMMYSFLSQYHQKLDFYIPDRYKEGYGISYEGIEYAQKTGVNLIIAMDCGIKAIKQVMLAKESDIDFIICDHHLPDEERPNAIAILNPKQADCNYPYKELSGCGVAFKLIQAYCEKFQISKSIYEELLDFLVISIACDIVPITEENRILAYWGLQRLNTTNRLGLRTLIAQSKRELPLTISDVVFGIGPMINASGRLADAGQAVRLMLSKEENTAQKYVQVLEYRNKLRKEFDQRISEEAKADFQALENWEDKRSIVLYQSHWHKGVIGIVASRLVEAFYRPTIILTESEGLLVGSARSIRGFDIHEALKLCDDLLVNWGGHKYAAGLSLRPEDFYAFHDRFEGVAQTYIQEEDTHPEIAISGELELDQINDKFWNLLNQFAPFGPGNRNPVFVSKNVKDAGYSKVLKDIHLKLSLSQKRGTVLNGIAFGRGDLKNQVLKGESFDICYTIEENKWRGRSNLQLMVKDLKF